MIDGNPTPTTSAASAATALASPGPSLSDDLAGGYTIDSASNPNASGSSYTGQVVITRDGELHRLSWTIPNTPPQRGVALIEGNTLAVGYGTQANYGVAVYRISGGTLTGRWAHGSTNGTPGTETLVGPAGLNGQYNATGVRPDGRSYTGAAQIVPAGSTYAVT